MTQRIAPQFLTVRKAATYAALSERSVRRLLSNGRLTPLRPLSGRVLIDVQELELLIRGGAGVPSGRIPGRRDRPGSCS